MKVILVKVIVSQRKTKIWGKAVKAKSLTVTIGLAMVDLYTVGPLDVATYSEIITSG